MAVRKHEQIFLITTFLFFQSVSLQNELILMHGDRLISTHYPLKDPGSARDIPMKHLHHNEDKQIHSYFPQHQGLGS